MVKIIKSNWGTILERGVFLNVFAEEGQSHIVVWETTVAFLVINKMVVKCFKQSNEVLEYWREEELSSSAVVSSVV